MNIYKDNRGVAALLTIIIVSAAVLIMAFSASILGMGELDMGWTSQKGGEAFAIADGCVEEALWQLRLDSGYTGDTLIIGENSCIIGVTSNGNSRTITVSGIVENYNKKIEVGITLNGNIITLNSWQELDS